MNCPQLSRPVVFRHRGKSERPRRGLTLIELLMAMSATAIIALGLASLAVAVYAGHEHVAGRTSTAQHGRVCLERIRRYVEGAKTSEAFPGCVVFSETVGSVSFPEILVIWSPSTITVANPTGLPLQSELIIITPDPNDPTRLLECTLRTDNNVVPALSNVAAWFTLIDNFRINAANASRVELTNLLRVGEIKRSGTTIRQGSARFLVRMTPSESDWTSYRAGSKTWDSLAWPLDFRGANTGLRRVTCAVELQLVPEGASAAQALPFFGASAVSYSLAK